MRIILFIILIICSSGVAQAEIDFVQYKLKYEGSNMNKQDRNLANTLRKHFKHEGGKEYIFSKAVVNDLADVIARRKLLNKSKLKFLRKEGNMFWYSMPTYSTKYSTVVGRIDIAFEKNEQDKTIRIVGLEDIYDFNPKKKGGRPLIFEIITRVLKKTVYRRKGTPFRMYYRANEM